MDIIYQALAQAAEEHLPQKMHALLQLDFENMFNLVSHGRVREELQVYFPVMMPLFDSLYPPDGNQLWFQTATGPHDHLTQEEGFAQGCPLSPFLSCLGLHRLLMSLQAGLDRR